MPYKNPEKERACGRRRYERITAERTARGMCPRCGKAAVSMAANMRAYLAKSEHECGDDVAAGLVGVRAQAMTAVLRTGCYAAGRYSHPRSRKAERSTPGGAYQPPDA